MRGATPMIVAEMIAVAARPAAPATPYRPPWGWQRPHCMFLEDCPHGCDDERGNGRPAAVPHPCNPVVVDDCRRVSRVEGGAPNVKRMGGGGQFLAMQLNGIDLSISFGSVFLLLPNGVTDDAAVTLVKT